MNSNNELAFNACTYSWWYRLRSFLIFLTGLFYYLLRKSKTSKVVQNVNGGRGCSPIDLRAFRRKNQRALSAKLTIAIHTCGLELRLKRKIRVFAFQLCLTFSESKNFKIYVFSYKTHAES